MAVIDAHDADDAEANVIHGFDPRTILHTNSHSCRTTDLFFNDADSFGITYTNSIDETDSQ